MALSPGTRLGPYEITAAIGVGGMGEVYRATDTKLKRQVAVKVLPESLAADPERLARFQREAEVLASLNHPNIAGIYGLEEADGLKALVMELVEGPTLADVIASGHAEATSVSEGQRGHDGRGTSRAGGAPRGLAEAERGGASAEAQGSRRARGGGAPRGLKIDDALPIAKQIAEALEAAHEQGIIHRDLKPANIKVRPDGTVKVLDFGLAKALEPVGAAASGVSASMSPTLTTPAMTQMGMILGTAAYMAPEQARGRAVDKRADIWAFGAVLYEMLTGTRAFAGEDLTETLASVVKEQPDLSLAPRELRRLLDRCLRKNPKERLRDIGDVWTLVDEGANSDDGTTATAAPSRLPWVLAAAAVVVAVGLSVALFSRSATEPGTFFASVALPAGGGVLNGNHVVVSPDGRHLALVADNQLWVRSFDSLDPTPLDRTEGASYPFWSPDSAFIGFFADDELKTVSRTGGTVQTLAPAPDARGGSWSPNGTILFSPFAGAPGLSAIAARGGRPRSVTAPPVSTTATTADGHRYPHFLPDGERFLYLYLTGTADARGVYVGSLDGTTDRRVLDGAQEAIFAPAAVTGEPGHLLYRRETVLWALPFDAGSLEATGDAFPVVDGVGNAANTGSGAFSVSTDGTLVYARANRLTVDLVWFDRSGTRLGSLTDSTALGGFSVSRDQSTVAISVFERSAVGLNLWMQSLSGGAPSRFTSGGPGWGQPVWAPDSDEVAYRTWDLAGLPEYEIRRMRRDMSGSAETLLRSQGLLYVWDWSLDGRVLVYGDGEDVLLLPLEGDDRTPVPFLTTSAQEGYAQLSPDGRWMAYVSNDLGEDQVFVKSVPATAARWSISNGGGTEPRWRPDGRELFYVAPDGTLMAVEVGPNTARSGSGAASLEYDPTPTPTAVRIQALGYDNQFTYQPSADGQRFAVPVAAPSAEPIITVVLNWRASVR